MAPASNTDRDFTDCIAVIRSLVLIRKQLTTLWDINSEYRSMEGENIPYSRFGFSTLEDMLRRCEEFNISRQMGGQVRCEWKVLQNCLTHSHSLFAGHHLRTALPK